MKDTQKKVKLNKRLLNQKMLDKFKTSFIPIMIGSTLIALIGIANIILLNFSSGFNIQSIIRVVIGIALLAFMTLMNYSLCSNVAKALSTAIVHPVTELQTAVQKIKKGELDIEITYESKDELGELANDLREACAQMQTIINDAGYMLGEMSEGNFTVSSDKRNNYVGDFETLIVSMEKLDTRLSDSLRQIQESSELVRFGSEQLATNAMDLASGATEQAGAVEQLSATIDDVAKIAEESAENAVTAATNAKSAADDAVKSREGFNQLTAAMDRITETSKEIENIIGAIEDIASQTNLLSLNASIEAARAGEAGRGFAVVADQIGKLAADSAQSAVTTKELISKSLSEIQEGNKIVEDTMSSIDIVLENMETFANTAEGAAEASKVQADMLVQIEAGIEQITTVIQSNSASAQETSAVSQELSTQAVSLEEIVAKFQIK